MRIEPHPAWAWKLERLIGTHGGAVKDIPAPALGAVAIRESLKRSGLASDKVQSLIMGNVIQAGTKMNPARQAGIGAGLPVQVPALTVNRVCGSGAQAIASAALEIWSGMTDCATAGRMENMDRAPYLLPQGRWGARMGDVTLFDSMLQDGLNDAFSGQHSGWHTEDLVTRQGISREDQDRWALRSQQRFSRAQAAGLFDAEIAAVGVPGRKGPVPAVRQALARAGWKTGDVERVEINEALAAIALACLRELGFAEGIVNVEGGAIAHGHPIGASGAVLATRLMHSMQRDGLRRGIVTLCIGGGQGIALALESL